MKKQNVERCYELFALLLEEEKIYMDPSVTFDSVCSWLGVEKAALDCYVESMLGCSGMDVIRAYRASVPFRFLSKYGILV